jgi:transcriptional regulator with XRE-family HTH domain
VKSVQALCANIRHARLARGWTQESMAEKVRVSPRHFQDIESQRREGIRLATIDRIAKALGVESWELLRPGRFPATCEQVRSFLQIFSDRFASNAALLSTNLN